jgi:cytochrome c oxidase assembly protein subunit 15
LASARLHRWFQGLATFAVAFALVVIVLGAYTRLSDAGLGCPDWPGCYGLLDVPTQAEEIERANQAFPERPVEIGKAWKEMVHRYFAGTLGLLILGLAVIALLNRRFPGQPVVLPLALLALVVFQGVLGMWTVTWQLKPVVVMGHLLGGFATLSLLWWLVVRGREPAAASSHGPTSRLLPWALLGLAIVVTQIALGGWTSSNYAALACQDFPRCHGEWWPEMDFGEGFVLWRGLGVDYEYGVLDHPARTAIHVTHRLGALLTAIYLIGLSVALLRGYSGAPRRMGAVVLGVLALQIALGISNIVFHLPLWVAVAHNATGAALLLTLVTLLALLTRPAGPAVTRGG